MIDHFQFQLATRIVWGPAEKTVTEEAAHLGAGRVLLVTDPGLLESGLADVLRGGLERSGVVVTVFAGVAGNPTTGDVAAATASAIEAGSEAIVALGGGSPIDVAKAAAMLLANGGAYPEYQWEGKPVTRRSHPLVAVPTTAGTGSEVTRVAVISDPDRHLKKGVLSPLMFPHIAVLDPALTIGLPARLTAATGMDAVSHSMEAFTGKRPGPLSDLLAIESLRLALAHLVPATRDGENLVARSGMMLAALYGGIAMDQAGLGLIHALSGGLCGRLHLHHGMTNAAIMPAVLEFNLPAIEPARRRRLAEVFGLAPDGADEELVARLTGLVEAVGLPVGFADRREEFAHADWEAIAEDSMQMAMITNNPRLVTAGDCSTLLDAMR
jgi:alcohol dehydrogenase class IV